MSEQTLEFITLRPPERLNQETKRLRYLRDLRDASRAPFREDLIKFRTYREKLVLARGLVQSPAHFSVDAYYALKYEIIVSLLREHLRGPVTTRNGSVVDGARVAESITKLEEHVPALRDSSYFSTPTVTPAAAGAIFLQYAAIWNSLYATTLLAGIEHVETNYLIDAIRAQYCLAALRMLNRRTPPTERWPWFDFDAYEVTIDQAVVSYDGLLIA